MALKKILIFSLAYYPKHVGGAEVAIKEITDRIRPEDITFHMVCLRFDATLPEVEQVGNVLVHRIGFVRPNPSMGDLRKWPLFLNKPLFQFLAFWKAHQLHKQYHYNAIWAMMAHSCGVPASLFKLFHSRVGYVQTLQEGDPIPYIEKKMLPLWPFFTRAFTTPTVIQCISNYLADWARSRGATCPVEVVPNGVHVAHFSQALQPEERAQVRAQLGAQEGECWLVTTSRLVEKNGIDTVIRALHDMPIRIHFAIFGLGPEEQRLRALAGELGVGARVHFFGQVDHAELPSKLQACDIFIRPSRSEGMGNSFIEAMVAGVPVIATQEGGIADFLFDAKLNPDKETTGWAVPKDNPAMIANAVKEIERTPEITARVVANARAMGVTRYNWDTVVEDMRARVFGKVVG